MEKICPHCNNVIDHLKYETQVTEWGTVDVDGDSYDSDDSEWTNGSLVHNCPECGTETDPNDLLNLEEANETEEESEREPEVINQESEMIDNDRRWNTPTNYFICPKCTKKLEYENEDETIICYGCNAEVNSSNSEKHHAQ